MRDDRGIESPYIYPLTFFGVPATQRHAGTTRPNQGKFEVLAFLDLAHDWRQEKRQSVPGQRTRERGGGGLRFERTGRGVGFAAGEARNASLCKMPQSDGECSVVYVEDAGEVLQYSVLRAASRSRRRETRSTANRGAPADASEPIAQPPPAAALDDLIRICNRPAARLTGLGKGRVIRFSAAVQNASQPSRSSGAWPLAS